MKFVSLAPGLPYREVLALQEKEFNARVDARRSGLEIPEDTVFLVEHAPVYTIGKHGDISHLLLSDQFLRDKNIEFYEINRGGDITYHGPGQLTVYPIVDLLRLHIGVKQYVHLLEQAVIDSIAEFGLRGERIEGKTGVWIGKGTPRERKISAIGVKCSRFITMHGLALNVGRDLSGFSGIVPCGLPQNVTSIGHELSMAEAEGGKVPDYPTVDDMKKIMRKKLEALLSPHS